MNEEDIVLQGVELDTSVEIELPVEDVKISETVDYISLNEQEEFAIDVAEVAGVVTGYGESSNHTHNIDQVGNLGDALNTLGEPHEIYSQNGGYAEFRQWVDLNTQSENRIGYFVSLVNNDGNNHIDICRGQVDDVYGVTVDKSAFCGRQYETYNLLGDECLDKGNSLEPFDRVCLLGTAVVRVHANTNFDEIHIGDFVIPDDYGCAIKNKKNNIGFKVIMRQTGGFGVDGQNCVMIALVPQNDNVARVMKELEETNSGLSEIKGQLVDLNNKVDSNISISGKFEDLEEAFGNLESNVDTKLEVADDALKEAIRISSDATTAMGTMASNYQEAMDAVDMAIDNTKAVLGKIDDYDLETLAQYKDKVVGFFSEANEDEVTIGTIAKEFGELSMIKQSADVVQHLVGSIDTYSVGLKSPTYGLSCNDAKGICQEYGYIYVPTQNHKEESYIYKCVSVLGDSQYYFTIGNNKYLFTSPTTYSAANLEYNSNINQLTIDGEQIEVNVVNDIGTAQKLDFTSELSIDFTIGKSYKWTYNKTDNKCEYWQQDLPVSFDRDVPNDGYELWYTRNGVAKDETLSEYIYNPNTLYRKTSSCWVAVATVNYKDARTMSLIEQTADSLSSTITNMAGDVSAITQRVYEIETLVKEDGNLSTINQTAENIRLGVYESGGGSSELELLLSGLRSDAVKTGHAWVCKVLDTKAVAVDGKYYAVPPVWNGKEFSFEGIDTAVDGTYCFASESKQKYYHNVNGGYDVYTCGNTAIASINTRVTDTESAIERLTKFEKDTSASLTAVQEKSNENSAQISSLATMQNVICSETKNGLSQEETEIFTNADKYEKAPIWYDACFTFQDSASDDGIYCILNDDTTKYYKLMIFEGDIIGYEQYELSSSKFAVIEQKIDKNGASIQMVVDDNGIKGGVIASAINGQSEVFIEADKIKINGNTTFSSTLSPDKTAISGDYIKTGVIASNNYNGTVTRIKYQMVIDTDNNVLQESENTSDFIYYTPCLNGKISPKDVVCYYCDDIKDGATLSAKKTEDAQYIVSQNPFDLIASDIMYEGTKFDLNVGTIYSKNFSFDADGNLEIVGKVTATSGYIGDDVDGFAIGRNFMYKVDANGLDAGTYCFCVDDKFYTFELKNTLYNGTKVVFSYGEKNIYIDNRYYDFATEVEEQPEGSTILASTEKLYYSLSNNQYSLWGNRGRQTNGIYIGPDGIGVGDGSLGIRSDGYFGTQGRVEIYYIDSENNETKFFIANPEEGTVKLNGDLTLDGNISMSGNITWNGSSSIVNILYARTELTKPTKPLFNEEGYANYVVNSSDDVWHTKYQAEEDKSKNWKPDYFASYSYDGGVSWTEAIKIRGEDGADGMPGDPVDLTFDNVFNALTDDGKKQGLFANNNQIYINASYIKTGTLSADYVSGGTLSGVTVESVDTNDNTITLEEGFFMVTPNGYKNPQLHVGCGESDQFGLIPYIFLGDSQPASYSMLGFPAVENSGVIFKMGNGMSIGYIPSNTSNFFRIDFLDNNGTGLMKFTGNIDFSDATDINFGTHAPSGGSGVAVFG